MRHTDLGGKGSWVPACLKYSLSGWGGDEITRFGTQCEFSELTHSKPPAGSRPSPPDRSRWLVRRRPSSWRSCRTGSRCRGLHEGRRRKEGGGRGKLIQKWNKFFSSRQQFGNYTKKKKTKPKVKQMYCSNLQLCSINCTFPDKFAVIISLISCSPVCLPLPST